MSRLTVLLLSQLLCLRFSGRTRKTDKRYIPRLRLGPAEPWAGGSV